MNNKNKTQIKDKLKSLFSRPKDIIEFCLPIIFALICLIPVPYTVTVGGGSLPIDDKIKIEGEYKSTGSLNSAYVKELKGTVITYLLSYVIPNYELNKIEDVIMVNENKDEYDWRERLSFTTSIDTAVLVAYKKLDKKIDIKEENLYISYIDIEAETDLKTGDKIIAVEDIEVTTQEDVSKAIEIYDYKKELTLTVISDKKEIKKIAKLKTVNGKKRIGIYIEKEIKYETEEDIKFSFTDSEVGPSGGLMMTLSIYNKLTKEDITKGKKIIGTGTINESGEVGEIGGVTYKLKGAVKAKADLFIVPIDNLEEALKEKERKNYKIEIIGVSTFDEALEAIRK